MDVRIHREVARLGDRAVAAAGTARGLKIVVALAALVLQIVVHPVGVRPRLAAAGRAHVFRERIEQKALPVRHLRVVAHGAVGVQHPVAAAVFCIPEMRFDVVERAVRKRLVGGVAEDAVRARKGPEQAGVQHKALRRVLLHLHVGRHRAVKAAVLFIHRVFLPERENRSVQQILPHFVPELHELFHLLRPPFIVICYLHYSAKARGFPP